MNFWQNFIIFVFFFLSEDRILADINTGSKLLDRQNGPNPRNLAAKALNCFLTTTLALQDFLIDY